MSPTRNNPYIKHYEFISRLKYLEHNGRQVDELTQTTILLWRGIIAFHEFDKEKLNVDE